MKKDIISMCGALYNASLLMVNPAPCRDFTENTEPMLERFLSMANQIAPRFLGLQISDSEVMVFVGGKEADFDWVFENGDIEGIYDNSDKAYNPTDDDYNWVFEKSARVFKNHKSEGLFEEGRRVYAISYEPEVQGDAEMDIFVGAGTKQMTDHFMELIPALLREKAVIRLFSNGYFIFSLPDEMPFRLRSLVSMSFPKNAKYTEIFSEPEKNTAPCCISRRCFNWSLILLWNTVQSLYVVEEEKPVPRSVVYRLKYELNMPFEEIEKYNRVSIDELELSVRSYNCLKRAGIATIGEALFMDDVELLQISNLGPRCKDEVKESLFEYVKRNISLPKVVCEEEATDYQEKLDSLIGLDDVKKQIRKITAFAKMKRDMEAKGLGNLPISLHMQFVGNPGTAKTTVARIVAGIFREIGLLSSGELIEVGRADLVGRYEGQTAPKVKETFERARGNVLFIDEAYSLVEEWDGAYGDEAINTIVQEMENNREDTIVIFAGYPDRMEDFISRNPGLRSRVPFKLDFKDYSEEELVQISKVSAKENGFRIDEAAEGTLAKLCREAVNNTELGNGRFCRNLIEHAILDYAERVYADDNPFVERNFVLLAEDFSLPMDTEVSKRRCIGFHGVA